MQEGGKTTEISATSKVLRVLSPVLFIIDMDEISRKVNAGSEETHFGYRKLGSVYIKELM